jgi:AraC-like DNA-binding protein
MNDYVFTKSFSFNEYSLKKHHHTDASSGVEWNYLAYMKAGESRFVTDSEEISVKPGDVFFIPYGCRYHSYWLGRDDIIWDSFAFKYFPNPENRAYPIQKIKADDKLINMIKQLSNDKSVSCSSVGLLYQIMGILLTNMKTEKRSKQSIIVENATRFMNQSFIYQNREFKISDVAKFCNISESGLYAAFRAYGTTPIETRQRLQIDHAVLLLTTTDLSVEEVSERAGFNSTAYFLRILRKITGKNSKQIRSEAVIKL